MLYFYIDAQGQTAGPVKKERLAACGVTLDTPVWHEGLADWVRAREVADLADSLPASPLSEPTTPAVDNSITEGCTTDRDTANKDTLAAPAPAPTCGYEPTENAASLAAAAMMFGTACDHTPEAEEQQDDAASASPAESLTAPAPLEDSPTTAAPTAPTHSPAPTDANALRTGIEAVERVNLIESLDLWKWLNIGLVVFAILGMCCSLSLFAIPCGVYGAVKAHDALRMAAFHDLPFLATALKQTKKWFVIGCIVFALSLFLGVVINWIAQ